MKNRPEDLPHRTADLPLSIRRSLEVEKQRELQDGLTRRHVEVAAQRQRYLADQFARLLRAGPALKAALDSLGKRAD